MIVSGIGVVEATELVVEIDELGILLSAWPRPPLFPLRACSADNCNRCGDFKPTRNRGNRLQLSLNV